MEATVRLLDTVGDEVVDVEEEVFTLFSYAPEEHDLGMVNPLAEDIEVTVAEHDFVIKQSPGLLRSQRTGGTTGAVVWQTSIRLANWIGKPGNPLAEAGLYDRESVVLELGAGINGTLASSLGRQVRHYIATDQAYTTKLLTENINANVLSTTRRRSTASTTHVSIEVRTFDWETDSVCGLLTASGLTSGVDLITSCDCVYNYALIEPLTTTCEEACKLRKSHAEETTGARSTICLVAQQLRQPDVFEQWLTGVLKTFRVWRVKDDVLNDELRSGSGFAVYLAILK